MEETHIRQPGRPGKAAAIVLAVCLVVMVACSALGHMIQTSWGSVSTQEITFITDVGATVHAKLYVPDGATADTPAPAVILCHGYTASLDAMEPNAIEFSRRGYQAFWNEWHRRRGEK